MNGIECAECLSSMDTAHMLRCNGSSCTIVMHTYCIIPIVSPSSSWYCNACQHSQPKSTQTIYPAPSPPPVVPVVKQQSLPPSSTPVVSSQSYTNGHTSSPVVSLSSYYTNGSPSSASATGVNGHYGSNGNGHVIAAAPVPLSSLPAPASVTKPAVSPTKIATPVTITSSPTSSPSSSLKSEAAPPSSPLPPSSSPRTGSTAKLPTTPQSAASSPYSSFTTDDDYTNYGNDNGSNRGNGKRGSTTPRFNGVARRFKEDAAASREENDELRAALANSLISEQSKFIPSSVPDAPSFHPSLDEFVDPFAYIQRIRPEAEKYGVVKIIPPAGWKPPMALDTSNFKFHTRLQKLHLLQQAAGFDSGKDYNFHSYREQADAFEAKWKASYLAAHGNATSPSSSSNGSNSESRRVSSAEVEYEYWRMVETGRTELEVEYGNDIDSMPTGSVFGTADDAHKGSPLYQQYPAWNLGTIATLPGCVLRHLGERVQGVSVPWIYCGMLFSSFCWHNEDNYLYSINYNHQGAAKTWYGVPGSHAEKFEGVMRGTVHSLFKKEPDLHMKLVTMLSPSWLVASKVPVYHALQQAGEFVVTYPKAYHAGFSHGWNLGEAVNLACDDWFPYGRDAVNHYRRFRRSSVFSHEHLLLMCAINEPLAHDTKMLITELNHIYDDEQNGWDDCAKSGIVRMQRVGNNTRIKIDSDAINVPTCDFCLHYCFLSYVKCLSPKCVAASNKEAKTKAAAAATAPMVPAVSSGMGGGRMIHGGSNGHPQAITPQAPANLVGGGDPDDQVVRIACLRHHNQLSCRCDVIVHHAVHYRLLPDDIDAITAKVREKAEKAEAAARSKAATSSSTASPAVTTSPLSSSSWSGPSPNSKRARDDTSASTTTTNGNGNNGNGDNGQHTTDNDGTKRSRTTPLSSSINPIIVT